MTVEAVLAWSICRSLIVAAVGLPLSCLIRNFTCRRNFSPGLRGLLILSALTPLFVPDLLTGFTYRLTSMRLLHSIVATEGLYAGLLLLKVAALQTAVLLILPPSPVSSEAIHSWRMLNGGSFAYRLQLLRLLLMGSARHGILTWVAGVLVCFQEFESAALLQVESHPVAWTVWLFDAQVAGESLTVSLGYIVRAMLLQAVLLIPLLLLLPSPSRGGMRSSGYGIRSRGSDDRLWRIAADGAAITFIAAGLFALLLWPLCSNAAAVGEGLEALARQGALFRRIAEISNSMFPVILSAVLALAVVRLLRQHGFRRLLLIFLLPGLCGSLFISLTLQRLFQMPVLNTLYDTPVPMVLGLVLFALPRACLLTVLLETMSARSALHSGRLLTSSQYPDVATTGRNLIWRLGDLRWLLALALLTHWCFWDVTIVFTLRPVQFEHVVTRLYNEMHYGRSESLIAGTMLTLVIPLMACVLVGVIWKRMPKREPQTHG